jgi:hypothetical protein
VTAPNSIPCRSPAIRTGWSIRKFVRTARCYRTIEIQAGAHTITAADPLPGDLRDAVDGIHGLSVRTNVSQVGSAARQPRNGS